MANVGGVGRGGWITIGNVGPLSPIEWQIVSIKISHLLRDYVKLLKYMYTLNSWDYNIYIFKCLNLTQLFNSSDYIFA